MPSTCSPPTVQEVTADSVNLTWTAPRKDGGRPISGYIVEKKEVGTDRWVKACPGQVSGTQACVKALQNGKEYEFRVTAVNEVGVGEKGDASDAVKVRAQAVPPRIQLDLFQKDVVVRAGEPLRIRIPYAGGNPSPSASCSLNSLPVGDGDNVKLESSTDNECIFVKDKCARSDAGKYSFLLKNERGSDQATVFVTVLDRPGPPEGPLRVSAVKGESCTLSWSAPTVGSYYFSFIIILLVKETNMNY